MKISEEDSAFPVW